MMLTDLHVQLGAVLAPDGIPLHYGNAQGEYDVFRDQAVLLDRRHEGRLRITGQDRHIFLNRMSTNAITNITDHYSRVTLFLNAQGRILERALVYNRADDVILISEPGRGEALENLLRRHIFYQDRVSLESLTQSTAHFALHGPQAEAFVRSLSPDESDAPVSAGHSITVNGIDVLAIRRKTIVGSHWSLITPVIHAEALFAALLDLGYSFGLRPAGGLAYHVHRVRVGYPAGREISSDYIPLEVGLWDDLNFSKGCYTGQEIIARMESRERVARLLVTLTLSQMIDAPTPILLDGREIGVLTSSAAAPDGNIYGLSVVKRDSAVIGQTVSLKEGMINATITGYGGVQPPFIEIKPDIGSD